MQTSGITPQMGGSLTPSSKSAMHAAANAFEVVFLAEMLKSAGLGNASDFSGGSGEDQFSSFLVEAQAKQIVEAGGLGISEIILKSHQEKS